MPSEEQGWLRIEQTDKGSTNDGLKNLGIFDAVRNLYYHLT